MRVGAGAVSENQFKPGDRVLWQARYETWKPIPATVFRATAKNRVSIRFDAPVVMPNGRFAKGMGCFTKTLTRME